MFLNYCRHRGAMPACGSGSATRFTCPYHAWTYKNDGKLFTVPGNAGFAGMDKGDYGLVELPNQERHGFIWAVLSADADIDVDAHLGDLAARSGGGGLPLVRLSRLSRVRVRGVMEGSARGVRGAYHFPFVHGESLIGQNALGQHVHPRPSSASIIGWAFRSTGSPIWMSDPGFLGCPRQHGRHLLDLPEPDSGQQFGGRRGYRYPARRVTDSVHRPAQLAGTCAG